MLKFCTKAFFKYLCKKYQEKQSDLNFFEAKQVVMKNLFTEISSKLRMTLEQFLTLKFVDAKNMLIKGNKRC